MNNLNPLWNWFKSGIHCPWSYKGNSTNQSLFPKTSAWTPVPLMHCWYFTHVAFNYMEIHYASQCGMVIPQTRTAESRALSASQGLLSPLCRASTSNAAKAELLKSSKILITPVTIFSVYCHLASASGAWWQKLRDWGGASNLRPSGSLTQTLTRLIVNRKTFIVSSVLLLCTYPVQPVCTSLLILLFSPNILFLHILFFCTFYSIAHFTVLPIYMRSWVTFI